MGGLLGGVTKSVGNVVGGVVNAGKSVFGGLFKAIGGIFGAGRSAARKVGQVASAGAGALSTGLGLLNSPVVWIGGGLLTFGIVYMITNR